MLTRLTHEQGGGELTHLYGDACEQERLPLFTAAPAKATGADSHIGCGQLWPALVPRAGQATRSPPEKPALAVC